MPIAIGTVATAAVEMALDDVGGAGVAEQRLDRHRDDDAEQDDRGGVHQPLELLALVRAARRGSARPARRSSRAARGRARGADRLQHARSEGAASRPTGLSHVAVELRGGAPAPRSPAPARPPPARRPAATPATAAGRSGTAAGRRCRPAPHRRSRPTRRARRRVVPRARVAVIGLGHREPADDVARPRRGATASRSGCAAGASRRARRRSRTRARTAGSWRTRARRPASRSA